MGTGVGPSKQFAQQQAARAALEVYEKRRQQAEDKAK